MNIFNSLTTQKTLSLSYNNVHIFILIAISKYNNNVSVFILRKFKKFLFNDSFITTESHHMAYNIIMLTPNIYIFLISDRKFER